jgi:predicted ATPase
MLTRLRLENFRSIRRAEAHFSELTVIVGANGSGKSNIIRALEFLSALASRGLSSAVVEQGGMYELIPKAIPRGKVRGTSCRMDYELALEYLEDYPKEAPELTVRHDIQFRAAARRLAHIENEKLVFNGALSLASLISFDLAGSSRKKSEQQFYFGPSHISVGRPHLGKISVDTSPKLSEETVPQFLAWLGMPFLREQVKTEKDFLSFIANLIPGYAGTGSRRIGKALSIMEPGAGNAIYMAPQAQRFRSLIKNMKKYHFMLNELRSEQQLSVSSKMSPEGKNLPTVLDRVRKPTRRTNGWKRILDTLQDLAPHVRSARTKSIASGKQFVEFVESKLGRRVESWDASDGTLRALAIMLALETHPHGSTILIEEPEQNLHPWAIRSLMDHVREVIEERGIQVILTTHSQQVLEQVHPKEVLVATRATREGTKLRTLEEMLPGHDIEMGEVGRMWVKGLLGGVPNDE